MTDEHDNHGRTPAAWTLVVIVLIGCLVSSIALVAASTPGFFVGLGIVVLGLVVGKVMQMMAQPAGRSDTAAAHAADPGDAGPQA